MRASNINRAMTLLAALLFCAAPLTAGAEEPLTLEQAVELALRNNPSLRAAEAQVRAAEAGMLRSRSAFLPTVTLSETFSRTDNPLMVFGSKLNQEIVTLSDFDPGVINNPDPLSNYNTRLAVMQPVFSGGREYLGVRQARYSRDASVQERERARQETVYGVIKAYYGVLLAKEHLKVAEQSLATSRENMRLAEARYRAGAVLQSDYLRAKVQYAEVQEMVTQSRNGAHLAAAALNFSLGVDQTTSYEIGGSLEPRQLSADLDNLIAQALERRPDLSAMELNRRSAETGVSQARTGYAPNLNVMGHVDWNSADFVGNDGKSWAVMAVLSWNLFDGLSTQSRVREALAASARMRALEDQTKSAVQLQVRRAYYRFLTSVDRIAATATSVQEAGEGLRIVQRRYEGGLTTVVDVLGAENALIRARTNALQAVYDNNVAHAELNLAVGTL